MFGVCATLVKFGLFAESDLFSHNFFVAILGFCFAAKKLELLVLGWDLWYASDKDGNKWDLPFVHLGSHLILCSLELLFLKM